MVAMALMGGTVFAQSNDSLERAKQQEALMKQQQKEQQELLKQQQKEQEQLQKEQQRAEEKLQKEQQREEEKALKKEQDRQKREQVKAENERKAAEKKAAKVNKANTAIFFLLVKNCFNSKSKYPRISVPPYARFIFPVEKKRCTIISINTIQMIITIRP